MLVQLETRGRGPHNFEVAYIVRALRANGFAICLLGNHELNLIERLKSFGRPESSHFSALPAYRRTTCRDVVVRMIGTGDANGLS